MEDLEYHGCPMVVDAHLHVWRSVPDHPQPSATIVSPCSDVPVELLRQYMGEHGVDKAVLVQPLYPGEDNSYVSDSAAADPSQLAAVCYVDPRREGADQLLRYWVRERGCSGLRIRPSVPGEEATFGQASSHPVWEAARELGVAINLLMQLEHIPALAGLAERFPQVPILIDHMASPDVTAGTGSPAFEDLLNLRRFPQVSVKVSGYYYHSDQGWPYRDCHSFFKALYDAYGAKRLIWGSDFPHVILKSSYASVLALQERFYTYLSSTELAAIMGGNAEAVYWSPPD